MPYYFFMKEIKIRCQGADNLSLESIKLFEGNPKRISREDLERLIGIITELHFVVPFHVWKKSETENILLDGHQRIAAIEEMGLRGFKMPKEYPVTYIEADNLKQAKKTLGAISSQYGAYEKKMLKEFFADVEVQNIRLVDAEIKIITEEIKLDVEEPEIEFTHELLEEHNYLVLTFDNKMDWMAACEKLGIKSVQALDSKAGYKRIGTGRVLKGGQVLAKLD